MYFVCVFPFVVRYTSASVSTFPSLSLSRPLPLTSFLALLGPLETILIWFQSSFCVVTSSFHSTHLFLHFPFSLMCSLFQVHVSIVFPLFARFPPFFFPFCVSHLKSLFPTPVWLCNSLYLLVRLFFHAPALRLCLSFYIYQNVCLLVCLFVPLSLHFHFLYAFSLRLSVSTPLSLFLANLWTTYVCLFMYVYIRVHLFCLCLFFFLSLSLSLDLSLWISRAFWLFFIFGHCFLRANPVTLRFLCFLLPFLFLFSFHWLACFSSFSVLFDSYYHRHHHDCHTAVVRALSLSSRC